MPDSMGGPDWVDNLAVACVPCNQRNGDRFNAGDFAKLTRHIRRKRPVPSPRSVRAPRRNGQPEVGQGRNGETALMVRFVAGLFAILPAMLLLGLVNVAIPGVLGLQAPVAAVAFLGGLFWPEIRSRL